MDTAKQQTEHLLLEIATAVSGRTGSSFLQSLVEHLVRSLKADCGVIGEISGHERVRVRVGVRDGAPLPEFEYRLRETPCENVVGRTYCIYPANIRQLFPRDKMLCDMAAEAYAGMPLWDSAGNPLGLIAIIFRRTVVNEELVRSVLEIFAARTAAELERERITEALRAAERRHQSFVALSFDGIWRWEMSEPIPVDLPEEEIVQRFLHAGYLAECNDVYISLRGLGSLEQALGSPAVLLAHDPARLQRIRDMIHGGFRKRTGEYLDVSRPGGPRWLESTELPVVQDGLLHRVWGVTRDVTAQHALRDAEERYRQLFEVESDAIFLLDCETHQYLDSNPAASKMYGYSRQEFLSMKAGDVSAEPAASHQALSRKEMYIPLRLHRKKNGTIFPVEIVGGCFDYQGRTVYAAAVRDITERMKSEEALRESEQRFRTLIESAPVAIGIARAGVTVYANQRYLEMYGFQSIDEVRGRSIGEQWAPDCRSEIEERARQRALGVPVLSEFEALGQRKDGSRFPVHAAAATVQLADGPATVGFLTDITERKRAEEALTQSEERFRKTFQMSPLPMAIAKTHGGIVEINDIALQKLGLTRKESVGRTADELGISVEPAVKIREEARKVDYKLRNQEVQFRARSGQLLTLLASTELVHVGDEPHLLFMAQDITQQKQQEDYMRMLGSAVASARDAIIITDADLNPTPTIIYANPAFTRLTGYTAEELCGHRTGIVLGTKRSDPKAVADIREALLAGREFHGEVVNYAKDGKLLYLELDIVPVRDAEGKESHYVAIRRDLSSRRKEELNRQQLLRLVLEAQTEERRRISRELHDHAGQLLTSMLLRLSALQEATSDKSVKEAAQGITSIASSALEEISRLARGLHPAVLDDLGLVEALRRAGQEFETSRIAVRTRISRMSVRLPQHIEHEIYQIVKEALTNVRKHSRADTVVLSLERRDFSVVATVKDNGIGFDMREGVAEGAHLGLIGMNERAALLGGSLLINSAPGAGTVVTLTVPLPDSRKGGATNES